MFVVRDFEVGGSLVIELNQPGASGWNNMAVFLDLTF